jgi:uncharacterized protein YigA (DUF484 family)
MEPTGTVTEVQPTSDTMESTPPAEGRRTQLKIVREKIQSLSKDVEGFRKSHEASNKKLEANLAALRKDLSAHSVSKDLDRFAKSTEANTKRLEKQIASLKTDLTALKSHVSKEAAKSRAKEKDTLSKALAKVKAKAPKKPTIKKLAIKKLHPIHPKKKQ